MRCPIVSTNPLQTQHVRLRNFSNYWQQGTYRYMRKLVVFRDAICYKNSDGTAVPAPCRLSGLKQSAVAQRAVSSR